MGDAVPVPGQNNRNLAQNRGGGRLIHVCICPGPYVHLRWCSAPSHFMAAMGSSTGKCGSVVGIRLSPIPTRRFLTMPIIFLIDRPLV